jgi:hypothetical protein
MLTIALAFALLGGIIWLLDLPFKRKIKNSNSVEESLKARRRLKRFRRFWSLFLIAVFSIVVIVIELNADVSAKTIGRDVGMIIAFAIGMGGWTRLRGNVQANSRDEYLAQHKDGYALYLRAFESDYYSKNPKDYSFEGNLVKAVESYRDICAIGMTKELDAPYGATRVYVSDESWQQDVKMLMQYAEEIFILMNDRQSCIWEITQSTDMLCKTCFIIDNESRYEKIKNELSDIHFPGIDQLIRKIDDDNKPKRGNALQSKTREEFDNGTIRLGLIIKGDDFAALKIDNLDDFASSVFRILALIRAGINKHDLES